MPNEFFNVWMYSGKIHFTSLKYYLYIVLTGSGPQENFGDPLTFPQGPSLGQTFNLSNTLLYDEMPVKLMALTSPYK